MTTLGIFYDENEKTVVVRITENISDKKIRVVEFNTTNFLALEQMQEDLKKAQNLLIENKSLECGLPFVVDFEEITFGEIT